jgi:hypothetical protein
MFVLDDMIGRFNEMPDILLLQDDFLLQNSVAFALLERKMLVFI